MKNLFYGYMTPIPIEIDGIEYKSKLEAKWSILLKRIGYHVEYESVWFNEYIGSEKFKYLPDFSMEIYPTLPGVGRLLEFFEVKPISYPYEIMLNPLKKVRMAAWHYPINILGNGPFLFRGKHSLGFRIGRSCGSNSLVNSLGPDKHSRWEFEADMHFYELFPKFKRSYAEQPDFVDYIESPSDIDVVSFWNSIKI